MHLKSYDDMERIFDKKQMYEKTKFLRKKQENYTLKKNLNMKSRDNSPQH